MNPETEDKVIRFVAKEACVKPNKLTLHTSLFHDLGIDGDDAIDFLKDFSAQFRVDLTELSPKSYFGPEGLELSAPFLWFLSLLGIHKSKLIPIYLSDLVEAAEAGRWVKKNNAI